MRARLAPELRRAEEYISADALAAQRRKREDAQQLAELNGVKKRVILCVIFALPILYVSMGHMAGLPLPSFMSPHHAPLTFALVQLALTLPIVIGGLSFYINGFGSLVKGHPTWTRSLPSVRFRHSCTASTPRSRLRSAT